MGWKDEVNQARSSGTYGKEEDEVKGIYGRLVELFSRYPLILALAMIPVITSLLIGYFVNFAGTAGIVGLITSVLMNGISGNFFATLGEAIYVLIATILGVLFIQFASEHFNQAGQFAMAVDYITNKTTGLTTGFIAMKAKFISIVLISLIKAILLLVPIVASIFALVYLKLDILLFIVFLLVSSLVMLIIYFGTVFAIPILMTEDCNVITAITKSFPYTFTHIGKIWKVYCAGFLGVWIFTMLPFIGGLLTQLIVMPIVSLAIGLIYLHEQRPEVFSGASAVGSTAGSVLKNWIASGTSVVEGGVQKGRAQAWRENMGSEATPLPPQLEEQVQKVIPYIQQYKAKNAPKEQVKQMFIQQGWDSRIIDEGIKRVYGS